MKILIADDEFLIREALATRISKNYYQFQDVYYAENGAEAFALIKEHDPDIVITDIRMEHMDGLDLIKKCRQENIQTPFIIISGYAEFEYAQTAIEHESCGYLLKPITNKKLFEAIDRAIHQCKERKLLSSTLQENTLFLINSLIKKCRQKNISSEEYEQLLKLLDGDESCEFMIANVHVSVYRQDRYHDQEDVYRAFAEALTRKIPVSFKLLPTEEMQNRLILFYDRNLTKKRGNITEILKSVIQRQKTLGAVMTIGLSRTGILADAELFSSAEQALHQRFEKGIGTVFSDHEARESKDISQIFDMKDFELRIKSKTGDEAALEFIKLVEQLYPHVYNLDFLFQYLYELLIRQNFHPDRKFWMNYIENKYWTICESKEEILAPVYEELKRTCAQSLSSNSSLYEQVKDFIHIHYAEDITLSFLADKYHLNPKYFSYIFKKREAITPINYLTQVRIEEAKKLLLATELPASRIASMVGYEDPRYFYKVFKKLTGFTPNEYRQQNRTP